MQLAHLVLAGGAAFVFARWAPLGRRERALFTLGYFPFYEYAVISRHYAAGAVLAWLACAAALSRRPALALGAALGLLCQTTVYGYILALAIGCGWLLDRWLRRRELAPLPRGEAAAGLVLALAGAVAGLVQLIPLPGTSFAPGWRFGWDPAQAGQVLRMPWRAFVPLPRLDLHFWNTNLLDAWPGLQTLAGLLMLALAARPALAPEGGPGGLLPRRRRHSRLRLRQIRRRSAPPGALVAALRGGSLAGRPGFPGGPPVLALPGSPDSSDRPLWRGEPSPVGWTSATPSRTAPPPRS